MGIFWAQEEPTLTAPYATATINGSHGSLDLAPDGYMPDGRVAAMFKHCCGYGAAAGGLNGAPAMVTERDIREIYLKPWRRAAAMGGRGVMPSHQTTLNIPCHGNHWLLTETLRKEFNWSLAYVLSDTGDVAMP